MRNVLALLIFLTITSPVYAYNGEDVLREVNTYRVSNNLKPLVTNKNTCKIAGIRVKEIQVEWKHKIAGRFWGYWKLGENLARNFDSASGIVQAWDKSPTHREIMVDSYKYGCVACENNYCAFNLTK